MSLTWTLRNLVAPTLLGIVCFCLPSNSFAQFSQSDLTGTWHSTVRMDTPLADENDPSFKFGTVTLDAAGAVTAGSQTDHTGATFSHTGGAFTVSSSGIVAGSITHALTTDPFTDHQLDETASIMIGADTDPDGRVAIEMAVKAGGTFSTADLEGTWWLKSHWDLPAPSFNDPGWDELQITLDSLGFVTFVGGTASNGSGPDLVGVQLVIDAAGIVSIPSFPTTKFKMAPNKDVMIGVALDGDGYVSGSALMRLGGGFVIGDMEGIWSFYQFYSTAFTNFATWTKGRFFLDSAGNVLGGNYEFPDSADAVNGGSFSLTTGGAAVGFLSLAGGGSVNLAAMQLNQAANFGAGVDSLGNHRILTVMVVPEPIGTAPLLAGLLLLVALQSRRGGRSAVKVK
jgi:hypothetical protein